MSGGVLLRPCPGGLPFPLLFPAYELCQKTCKTRSHSSAVHCLGLGLLVSLFQLGSDEGILEGALSDVLVAVRGGEVAA